MNRLLRILLPVIVVSAGVAIGLMLMATGPEVERRPPARMLPTVEVMVVQPQQYQVLLHTQGTVTPRTQSTLIPEVAGRIISIAHQFRSGESFAAGAELFAIDPTDYQNAIIIARADLARARLALAQENALAKHALDDWKKLGRQQSPTDLTLHKPQVASAKAEVAAAEAQLRQAETNLRRTHIRAPYAGRVLEKMVDVGQYVSPGTVAATLYAVDVAEVRLPLTDRQLAFVDLPNGNWHSAPVILRTRVGRVVNQWQGRLVRTESAIDVASRQLFVVAKIDHPFQYKKQQQGSTPPLKMGQFVEADISGHLLNNVFVLPRQAVENDGQVLVVNAQNQIERRAVQVVLRKGGQVIVSAGLQAGERISLTPMPFAREGTAVEIAGEQNGEREYPPLPVLAH